MNFEDGFLRLLGKYASDQYNYQKPVGDLHSMVMERAGLTPRRKSARPFRPLLVAAIVASGLLIAAAAYYGVSDAFRGVLQEQTSDGQSRPISSMAPVVERSGTLVGDTASHQGVEVTVRGVVGDSNGFKILLDIVDTNGAALALEQIDGSLSNDDIRFGGLYMRTDETKDEPSWFDIVFSFDVLLGGDGYVSARDEMIDNDHTDNRTTILIDVETDTVDQLVGQTLYLTLTDLLQFGLLRGEPVGMQPNDLFDLVSAFPAVSEDDFLQNGYYQDLETGEIVYYYELITDSAMEVPLAPGLPDCTVTNAAVWNGVLYLRGTAPKPTTYESILPNAELRNFERDTQLSHANDRITALEDDPSRVRWEIAFPGVTSREALRGYVLALEGGDESSLHPLRRGEWSFEIPLQFEDTTHVIALSDRFAVGGFTLHARELVVSPYYMRLHTDVDADTYEAMMHIENPIIIESDSPIESGESAWDKIQETAVLTMKDGSVTEHAIGGWSSGDGHMEIGFDLQFVIDPAQIASITFGDLEIRPNITQ